MENADEKQKALYAGLSAAPVTYQNLEEFLIGLGEKEPVSVSLKTTANEFYGLREPIQESFDIHKTGWGHLRLETGDYRRFPGAGETMSDHSRKILSEAPAVSIMWSVQKNSKKETSSARSVVKSPYQELVYHVTASRGARIRIDLNTEEKRRKASLVRDDIDYCEEKTDFRTWAEKSHRTLERLRESGNEYPEYRLFQKPLFLTWRITRHLRKKFSRTIRVKNLPVMNWKKQEFSFICVRW